MLLLVNNLSDSTKCTVQQLGLYLYKHLELCLLFIVSKLLLRTPIILQSRDIHIMWISFAQKSTTNLIISTVFKD